MGIENTSAKHLKHSKCRKSNESYYLPDAMLVMGDAKRKTQQFSLPLVLISYFISLCIRFLIHKIWSFPFPGLLIELMKKLITQQH